MPNHKIGDPDLPYTLFTPTPFNLLTPEEKKHWLERYRPHLTLYKGTAHATLTNNSNPRFNR